MIRVRRGADRGHFDHGWLDTYHTFSFGSYYDPDQIGFRSLRVINEDRFAPGAGFGMHPHRDMEIITYVLSGALEHRDSLGNRGVVAAGEFQRMTAGTGIRHSEINASPTEPLHLYQIWLLPDRTGLTPGYEQRRFDAATEPGSWQPVAAPEGHNAPLTIHQDARLFLAELAPGEAIRHTLDPARHAWLQVLWGSLRLTDTPEPLAAGDGAALSGEPALTVEADEPSRILLFDLA